MRITLEQGKPKDSSNWHRPSSRDLCSCWKRFSTANFCNLQIRVLWDWGLQVSLLFAEKILPLPWNAKPPSHRSNFFVAFRYKGKILSWRLKENECARTPDGVRIHCSHVNRQEREANLSVCVWFIFSQTLIAALSLMVGTCPRNIENRCATEDGLRCHFLWGSTIFAIVTCDVRLIVQSEF